MKHLIDFVFYYGDEVRVINEDSPYFGQIGIIRHAIIRITKKSRVILCVAVTPTQKENTVPPEPEFIASQLEKVVRK